MTTEFKRYPKYEVMKLEDIEKYLSFEQRGQLANIIRTLEYGRLKEGKPACNSYVVVNEDQSYAEQVWALIKEQWEKDKEQTSAKK